MMEIALCSCIMKTHFCLDPRLEQGTVFVAPLSGCQLRLMDEARWLWLVLVPELEGVEELHLLPHPLRGQVMEAIFTSAALLQKLRPQAKINIGMLGNIVRQLHIHVLARLPGDANWPGPVWGYGAREALSLSARRDLSETIRHALKI